MDKEPEKIQKRLGRNGNPPPSGRPKGTPNKATANARQAIGDFVEGNVGRLNGLLDTIEREQGAQAAWDCIVDVLEYHVPKLARTELQPLGADGKPTDLKVTVELVNSVNKNPDPQ